MSHRSPAALASLALFAALALPARAVRITELPILSADAGAQYVTVAGDGSVYFTEYTKGRIGVIDRFGVPSEIVLPAGSKPMHIYTGADGHPWWADDARDELVTFSPIDGLKTTSLPMTDSQPRGMTTYWGSVLVASYAHSLMLLYDPVTGQKQTLYATPYGNPLGMYDAAIAIDGRIWLTFAISNALRKVVRVNEPDPGSFVVPTANSTPTSIVSGPDGNLWFTERTGNKIGRIDPRATAAGITEFALPGVNSQPYDLVVGPDGNIWFTEYAGGKIGRITPAGVITEYPLPSGTASGPRGIARGLDGTLWVVEYPANQIAKVVLDVSGDANGDGAVNVADVFYMINFLFAGGTPPV
jgi:streptogramin lyase